MTAIDASAQSPAVPYPIAPENVLVPGRVPEARVDPLFVARWSPRSFLPDPVDRAALDALFEAARWAPSSNNEQPWQFVYAVTPEDRARFLEGLLGPNQVWAQRAPVLVYLLARRNLSSDGGERRRNATAWFDAGAAWMSLALQAQLLGLSAHAMGGIDRAKAARILGVDPEEYDVLVAIAIGRRGDPSILPEGYRARETASGRRPLREVAVEGRFLNGPDGAGRPKP